MIACWWLSVVDVTNYCVFLTKPNNLHGVFSYYWAIVYTTRDFTSTQMTHSCPSLLIVSRQPKHHIVVLRWPSCWDCIV